MPISSHLAAVRAKVGHDLLTLCAASISIFDGEGRLLLGKDAETDFWTLPGGAVDPVEQPSDAAVRECFEETGLQVEITRLIGVFGGQEFLITYPNGDVTYYTTIAFEARIVGGAHQPDGVEMARLAYFSREDCANLNLSPSSRVISERAFERPSTPWFSVSTWKPEAI
ncbi:NUDIX domain-containing protein [Tardiphaga sp. 619_E2_N8_5]|uniref:NUDIX domain-containing protein n=1 Tax=unclassified Tardiphaga TaxID=2631404 RepID=UPI003F21A9B7